MATGKLDASAFALYVGMGPGRSMEAVAKRYGCTKRAVVKRAVKENWRDQIVALDAKAKESSERKASESLEQMSERHLKMLRAIQTKGLQVLQSMPLDTAYQATRAILSAIEQERVVRGEPGERTAVDLEKIIRREYEQCFLKPGQKDDWKFGSQPA